MRLPALISLRRLLPIVTLAAAIPTLAWTHFMVPLTLQPESKLWVEGKSTIKDFTCKAQELSAVVEGGANAVAQVAAGEKGIQTVKVTVPADKMECGNGTMNEHMKKALKVEEFPTIQFKLTSYDVSKGAEGSTGTLKGTLTLGGVQKSISIPAESRTDGGALHVTGAYEVKMSEYELKPPSLMFGRIKVRDAVDVKFDLLLKS
jgi:polyisoprenoid-binding protein YceI